eukprot:TRINITY_DN1386_c0_g1_i6.p1 TRINITY_DN1386_c0_g1~~TRINITY_DN1386_c0_g1_i6.p1  ORF type:complete len:441 (-),score=138.81 TRINITY_DN1386_c0_g1_i6:20-1342(-)
MCIRDSYKTTTATTTYPTIFTSTSTSTDTSTSTSAAARLVDISTSSTTERETQSLEQKKMGENLMTLRCIFENVDEGVLMLALEEAGGDLQRAIDVTLEMTGGGGGGGETTNNATPPPDTTNKQTQPPPKPAIATVPKATEKLRSQEEEDEALARALQEQFLSSANADYDADDDAELARRLQFQEQEQLRVFGRGGGGGGGRGGAGAQRGRHHIDDDDDDDDSTGGSDFIMNFLQLTAKDGGMVASGVLESFKGTIQNLVEENLNQLDLPGVEEENDALSYSIGAISFETVEIDPNKITITPLFPATSAASTTPSSSATPTPVPTSPTDVSFQLGLEINTTIKKFSWAFKKKTFPKLKDDGFANAKINSIKIQTTLQVVPNPRTLASLRVTDTKVNIKKVDLKISGTKASVIYNMLLSLFSGTIKKMIDCLLYTSPSPRD